MKLRIEQDTDPVNPRKELDHLGKIVHWHRRYDFGERIENPALWFEEQLGAGAIILPLSLLDHSGLHLWIGSGAHPSDAQGWDSGQVGYVYATAKDVQAEFGDNPGSLAETRTKVEKILRAEVEEFDQYLRGDVWGYIIQDDEGNTVDSCWGFYGHAYAEEQGREALAHCEANARELALATTEAEVWP